MTTAKKAIRAKKDWTTFTFHSFGPKDIHSSRPLSGGFFHTGKMNPSKNWLQQLNA